MEETATRPRPIVLLAPDTKRAETLALDLHFFLGEAPASDALHKRVQRLSDWGDKRRSDPEDVADLQRRHLKAGLGNRRVNFEVGVLQQPRCAQAGSIGFFR